jgi:hypothetical protein
MARQPDGRALVLGMALVAAAWVVLLLAAVARGRGIPPFSLAYNVPITLAFGALALDIIVRIVGLGWARFAREHAALAIVWAIGAVVLALRLVAKSIDVSGHMAWSLLMGVQCIVECAPRWFTLFVWAVVAQILLLNAFVLGGQSGLWGALTGLALGGILILDVKRQRLSGARVS